MKIVFSSILVMVLLFAACGKDHGSKPGNGNNNGTDTSANSGDTLINHSDSLQVGLIAYYPFNANTKDESGNGYDLVNQGALLSANRFGESQKAFVFNGISDFMILPKILKADSLRDFTISLWAKPAAITNNAVLSFIPKVVSGCFNYLGFGSFENHFYTRHQIIIDETSTGCSSSILGDNIADPRNSWCHIIITQKYHKSNNGSSYTYLSYFNTKKSDETGSGFGGFIEPTAFGRGGAVGSNNVTGDYSNNFYFFNGAIDDIRIYNRTLSDDEVRQLYLLHE